MAAIASSYRRIPVAHVEAGLRTHDLANPFPEEMNRTLVDRLSQWHFAPTEGAKENLLSEGLSSPGIFVTGNTVVDSLVRFRALLETPEKRRQWTAFFQHELELPLQAERRSPLVLVTCHRRESFGPDLEAIVQALKRLVKEEREIHLVLPIHPNPHVRGPVREALEGIDRLHLTEPLSYEPFLFLLTQSQLILTDSGGVQEEAPSLGVPTLVMRKKTERPELIQAGWGELVGTSTDSIVETARRWLHAKERPSQPNPFGDGHAAPRIAEILKRVCQT